MNKRLNALLLFFGMLASSYAADGVDAFRSGLRAFQPSGSEALLQSWYSVEDTATIDDVRSKLMNMTKGLGEVVDTEVFAPKNLGHHIQRLYGVIYFRKRPLWIRAEYYSIEGRSGFLSLEFSLLADDVLPLEIGVASK